MDPQFFGLWVFLFKERISEAPDKILQLFFFFFA